MTEDGLRSVRVKGEVTLQLQETSCKEESVKIKRWTESLLFSPAWTAWQELGDHYHIVSYILPPSTAEAFLSCQIILPLMTKLQYCWGVEAIVPSDSTLWQETLVMMVLLGSTINLLRVCLFNFVVLCCTMWENYPQALIKQMYSGLPSYHSFLHSFTWSSSKTASPSVLLCIIIFWLASLFH
jgi:hypothetical protein